MRILKSDRKLFLAASFTIVLVVLIACQGSKERTNAGDSTLAISDSTAEPLVDTAAIDDENINDEDHGGPGISDTQVSFEEIELPSQNLLLHLMKREVADIVDTQTGFVILEPGPGVAPIASVRNSVEEVLGVNQMLLLLSDSSFSKKALPFYTWHFDRCEAEYLPDGVYLDDVFIEEINSDLFREEDKEKAKQVSQQWKGLTYRYAKVFNIKLTTTKGELVLFSFTAFLRNDKLFLMTIDLTDCGA